MRPGLFTSASCASSCATTRPPIKSTTACRGSTLHDVSTAKQNSTFKSVQTAAQQTSTDVWVPASGKRIAITHVQIAAQAATAAKLTLYFGAGAYVEGTSAPVFKGTLTPVAASGVTPVVVMPLAQPIFGPVGVQLKITTSAALDCDVVVYGYET